ncbi:DUF6221 family protein [Nocardia wallacei]|uniref:DUF6221 family protein n=1 Tax=Nocardia wallacei TaxID=480035 RepID=UPI0024553F9A|nr:DUF6221 family protein [Nocardia wallacei]
MTIVEFIEARIAEDEQIAQSAIDPERPGTHWCWEDGKRDPLQPGNEPEELDTQAISLRTVEEYPTRSVGPLPAFILCQVEARLPGGLWHIARHDPERVLRQCAAMRNVVKQYRLLCPRQFNWPEGMLETLELNIRSLASIWSDHPDYREEEWRVDAES